MRTRVGYTGGTTKNPNYNNIGDHTETLQIEYDPAKISFKQIMEVFWETHNHCKTPYSRQYMSAVFYHNEGQKKIAEETRERHAKKIGDKVTTDILPLREFTLAEDYHQKYMLRQSRALTREFQAMYPEEKDFLRSTAVARVNSYLGGHGSVEQLEREIGGFGLSETAAKTLLKLVKQSR